MATSDAKRTTDTIADLKDLVIAYAKQETVEPLRGLGRYLGYGIGGALLVALGVVLLGMAGLRALQTETGTTFTGNWSFAPYFIVLAGLAIIIALLARAITGGKTDS